MLDLSYKPHFTPGPNFANSDNNSSSNAAMLNGKRYENKALLEIGRRCGELGWKCNSGPWIKYKSAGESGLRFCQPDVLVEVDASTMLLVEIKLKHTRRAFPQLDLYTECLQAMKPEQTIYKMIFCKWFDPVEGVVPLVNEFNINREQKIVAYTWGR